MPWLQWRTVLLLSAVLQGQIGLLDCLKLLELDVPSHKLVGEGVKLVCRFDMEGDALYSVKWYRNEQEFYRFVPNDRPKLQIFPQHGIRVERSKSSRQHVFLFDLQLEASGTYRCEVSAEAPSFRTKHEEKVMVVVQEPYHNEIIGLQPSYQVGDLVNTTCYSRGSSPPAELAWKINDHTIYDSSSQYPVAPREGGTERGGARQRFARGSQWYDPYGQEGRENSYQIIQPQVAEPKLVFGSIKDWFEKQDSTSSLDTAASNLQFQVEDIHLHIGLRLECTASIGPVYWHSTQESASVTARVKDLHTWGVAGGDQGCLSTVLALALLNLTLLLLF